jgi:arylsulfatase
MASTFEVIMAAYPSTGPAERDFDSLVQLVKGKEVRSEGVILVEHDIDGQVRVSQTGDHLGRKGLGWGGGVGLAVGLFSPPLLASVAVGAAAGALVGRFARHKVDSGIEQGLGDKLQPGTAVVIAIVDGDHRLAAEQALGGSPAKSVAPMDKKGLGELKAALAEAAGKFSPDRTVLPIPDRTFGGTMGRTMGQSVPDWLMIPGPQPPEGAPNVLIVLIDDAGFGNPDTFGGPISTPTLTRVQNMGLTYNRFHVTAVCSPTRAALLTGRNHHRVGFGSIAEYPGPYPGYTASRPRSCTALPRILRENGYVTGGFGKWHLTPDNVQGPAGPFDRWPQA